MFSCLEGIRMRIKERNRKQMYDKQKRRYNSQRKKRDDELKDIEQEMKTCPICDKDQLDDKKDKNRWISCFKCAAWLIRSKCNN